MYRSHDVMVANYIPPPYYRVAPLMNDCVNVINWMWQSKSPLELAAYVLWRINHIHPFVNGNGRTAGAACYFVLCVKSGGLLTGNVILPELLRANHVRDRYIASLQFADEGDLSPLITLLNALITKQLND